MFDTKHYETHLIFQSFKQLFLKKNFLYQDNEKQIRFILEKQLCKMNSIRLKNEKSIRHESNERLCEKF